MPADAEQVQGSDSRTIRIVIGKGHVAVTDSMVQAVERCWELWKVQTHLFGVRLDQHGRFRFPAGLVPSLLNELEKDGYRIELVGRSSDDCGADTQLVGQAQGTDRRYLEAVLSNRIGVVEVNDTEKLVTRIAQLISLYPAKKVVVAIPTRKRVWKVWQTLGELLGEPVGLVTAKSRRPGRRCVVCTYRTLSQLPVREDSILVVADAERATDDVARFTVGKCAYTRVYGLIQAGITRDEIADLRLKALAGEVIFTVGGGKNRARVLLVSMPTVVKSIKGHGLRYKCRTVWQNRTLNRLVARLANALLNNDMDQVRACGVNLDLEELLDTNQRVAVLVESTSHAKELRSLLRDWPIFSMVPLELKQQVKEKVPTSPNNFTGVIVTSMYAMQKGVDADIIIRATGGNGTWLVKESPAAQDEQGQRLLFDFVDTHDTRACRDTHLRVRDYRSKGMTIEGKIP